MMNQDGSSIDAGVLERAVVAALARELDRDEASIDPAAPMAGLNLDVQAVVAVARALGRASGLLVSAGEVWDLSSIRALAEHIAGRADAGATGVRPEWSAAELTALYNVAAEFYRLWLDDRLVYSSALWAGPDDTLEHAQLRKLDFHVDGAAAAGKRRVLDVGCGWGALLERLVDAHGVERAIGLTQSAQQATAIRARGDARLEVHGEHWSRHRPDQPYDAIVAIGPLEYFAAYQTGGRRLRDKVPAYRGYFRWCHEVLAPGGAMTLQTVVKGNTALDRAAADELAWLYTEMFPGIDFPRFSDVVAASEGLFEITAVRIDRGDYVRTMAAWHGRLSANRARAVALVGEDTTERYLRYMQLAGRQFAAERFSSLRFVMRRVDRPFLP
jgi:cyclopropane-fatty-acyl-phospholipid synthase